MAESDARRAYPEGFWYRRVTVRGEYVNEHVGDPTVRHTSVVVEGACGDLEEDVAAAIRAAVQHAAVCDDVTRCVTITAELLPAVEVE